MGRLYGWSSRSNTASRISNGSARFASPTSARQTSGMSGATTGTPGSRKPRDGGPWVSRRLLHRLLAALVDRQKPILHRQRQYGHRRAIDRAINATLAVGAIPATVVVLIGQERCV